MERFDITDDRAAHVLQRIAAASRVGVQAVARAIVDRTITRGSEGSTVVSAVWCTRTVSDQGAGDRVRLVADYIAAAQRARETQSPHDLDALRRFLSPDLEVKLAASWTDTPWRVVSTSADQLLRRFTDPINRGTSLSTETVNLVPAGPDVLVEQLSTITCDGASVVSMVCHIFTITDDRISSIRAYRNDQGIPPG